MLPELGLKEAKELVSLVFVIPGSALHVISSCAAQQWCACC